MALRSGRGLFDLAPVQMEDRSTPEPNAEATPNVEAALPWSPRSIAVKNLGQRLAELDDPEMVRALAGADGRSSARSIYERRLAELAGGPAKAGGPSETASGADGRAQGTVLAGTDQVPGGPATTEPGGEEDMLRITVYATLDQVEHLDDDRRRIRRASRVALDRTAIIRGLLEGYRRSGLDLVRVGVRSEEGLADLIADRLTGGEI